MAISHEKLRVGLIGTGSFGPNFATYITEHADLVAVCDPNPAGRDEFAKQTGLRLPEFDHHEGLLEAADVDAVVICSPNATHKEIAVAAAEQGKHVFCEKAMATCVPDCWEMVRACDKANTRLMVGHKRRLRPPWARMIELRKELGDVLAITSCGYFDSRPYPFAESWWRFRDKSGGTLMVSGVHVVDWMRAMCGDVASVRALAAPQADRRYDFPDTLHVALEFNSGAVASLSVSLVYPPLKFRESGGPQVVYQDGGARLVAQMEQLDLYWQRQDEAESHFEQFDDIGIDHAFSQEFGDFVRWVADADYEPCLTWREGLRCVEVMEAAHRSADEGGSIIRLPLYPELEIT
ncbi:MAG: Gfo/Idh/MocA family oxidoreductase [Pirellulales bacterium]|nr:Gfo/Idh/MocA family oxidoreductase [Pirellulales bacterium]